VHYRNLKFYLERGLKLTAVHRVLRFEQHPWLKTYIMLNTEMRTKATTVAEKDFFKLMNNAVFGRSMMNVRKQKKITLLTSAEQLRKAIASPAFYGFKQFKPELAAVQYRKDCLLLDKPLYTGFVTLDLSKLLMYQTYYGLKDQYGDRMELLFTDTDSLCMQIQTEDIYRDMAQNPDLYDTSDFPTDHFLYSTKNKKVIGKFKDETNGNPITHFVGLRPKMYAMRVQGEGEKKTAKGISRTVIKKTLTYQNYHDSLFQCRADKVGMVRFQTHNHQIYTVHLNKTGLSPADNKRYLLEDGIHTRAHGDDRTLEEQRNADLGELVQYLNEGDWMMDCDS
jgi:hypothetical protein